MKNVCVTVNMQQPKEVVYVVKNIKKYAVSLILSVAILLGSVGSVVNAYASCESYEIVQPFDFDDKAED